MRLLLLVFVLLLFRSVVLSMENQERDSLNSNSSDSISELRFNYKQIIIPSVLIGYGAAGFKSDAVKKFDNWIKNRIDNNACEQIKIDDYLQYAPAVTVYALNFSGVKGKHSFVDRSVILGTSFLLVSLTVSGLKDYTSVRRPDRSAINSFPSGHTATAFMCAEFMHQEYKDQSIWYSVAGYTAATATGALRMYNVRHWFSDVVAGAGIGILGTKIAYWTFPYMKRLYTPKKSNSKTSAVLLPYYNGNDVGVGLAVNF